MEEARAEPLDRALPPLFSTLHVRVRGRLVSDPLCEEENEELMLSGDLLGRAGEEVWSPPRGTRRCGAPRSR